MTEAHDAYQTVREAFLAVWNQPAAERLTAVAAISEERVRVEVASLLAFDVSDALIRAPAGPVTAEAPAVLGTTVDPRFDIQCLAAEGGSGWVFRAIDAATDAPVAVKVFKSMGEGEGVARLRASFVREVQILTSLSEATPHIARYLGAGIWRASGGDFHPYLAMDWLDGPTLRVYAEATYAAGAEPAVVMNLLRPVAEALSVAHANGVAHRDLKPDNVICVGPTDAPVLKVVDFGAAKVASERARGFRSTAGAPPMITWEYAAPEQLDGALGSTGPWTDVYALALIASELMAGRHPWMGMDLVSAMRAGRDPLNKPTPRRMGVAVSDAVEAVFETALSPDSDGRYQDVRAFFNALASTLGLVALPRPAVGAPVQIESVAKESLPVPSVPSDPSDPSDPKTLGRFHVLERAGSGAMGVVYAAYDPVLDRRVAVKVLTGHRSAHALREARIMASVEHPSVARVYEVGEVKGRPFITMEFVEGATLDRWLSREQPNIHVRVALLLQIGEGIQAAHQRGVRHGDIKPGNIIIAADGRPRVVDFGLAGRATDNVTGGTVAYMAPEQLEGEGASFLTDQFAFCALAYEVLSGEPAHRGETASARRLSIADSALRSGGLSPALERPIRRGLAEAPSARWPGFSELVDALRDALPGAEHNAIGVGPRLAVFSVFAVLLAVLVGRAALVGPPSSPWSLVGVGGIVTCTGLAAVLVYWRRLQKGARSRRLGRFTIAWLLIKQAGLIQGAFLGMSVAQMLGMDSLIVLAVGLVGTELMGVKMRVPVVLAAAATGLGLIVPSAAFSLHNAVAGLILFGFSYGEWHASRQTSSPFHSN